MLGLFADSPLDYYLNRRAEDATQPLLPEMARTAVELLDRSDHGRQHGYFLLIEAGRVDHLGHANHPAIAHEQLEYDAVFREALARTGERTLVV